MFLIFFFAFTGGRLVYLYVMDKNLQQNIWESFYFTHGLLWPCEMRFNTNTFS